MTRFPRKVQWIKAAKKCGGRCWYCGALPAPGEIITIDHAKPRSRGGLSWDDNLLPACNRCNNLKGNLTVSEFRKYVKIRIIRRLFDLGYYTGNPSLLRIVFWGEGNDSVLSW